MSSGKEKVVRKEIRLNSENKTYAKYELKLMQELSSPYVVRCLHSKQ